MPNLSLTYPTIDIQFGKPEHGWLPFTFCADDFRLTLNVSDVPVNPLETLCEALAIVLVGGNAQVLWFLEPAECWFNFENQTTEVVLTVTERPSRSYKPTQLLRLIGTVNSLLVPFYRTLKAFTALAYSEPHWPESDKRKLVALENLLPPDKH